MCPNLLLLLIVGGTIRCCIMGFTWKHNVQTTHMVTGDNRGQDHWQTKRQKKKKKLELPEAWALLEHSRSGALAGFPTPTPLLSPLRKVKIQFECDFSFGVNSEKCELLHTLSWKLAMNRVVRRGEKVGTYPDWGKGMTLCGLDFIASARWMICLCHLKEKK